MRGRRRSGEPPFWVPGTRITWREGSGPLGTGPPVDDLTQHHFASPVTVLRDDPDGLVVWLPTGTPVTRVVRADGLGKRDDPATMFTARSVAEEGVHQHYDQLRIAPTGRPWSVWLMWEALTGTLAGWYVNLERPHVRDAASVYTSDHVLDVAVGPDRSAALKDEDELALAVQQGVFDHVTAARIRADAVEVSALVTSWGSPFSDGWEHRRP